MILKKALLYIYTPVIARQVRAGLQTDPEDPQKRKEQTCHHCQQYSSPQVDF